MVSSSIRTKRPRPAARAARAVPAHLLAQLELLRKSGLLEALTRPAPRLTELWDWWRTVYLPRLADRATLKQQARDYLLPELGRLRAGELMPCHVEAALDKIARSPRTVNGVRGLLRKVIRDGQANGRWPGHNPVDAVKPRRLQRAVWPTLCPADARALVERERTSFRLRWALSIYLGLRPGETRALRRGDVLEGAHELVVARSNRRDTTKTGCTRRLPICSELWPIVAAHLVKLPGDPQALLFPSPRGGVRPAREKLSIRFRAALRRAGISRGGVPLPTRAYDLRHTFHALARRAGVNREVIRMAMGHAGDVTGGYGQPSLGEMRSELERLTLQPAENNELPEAGTSGSSMQGGPTEQPLLLSRHRESNTGPTDYESRSPAAHPKASVQSAGILVELPKPGALCISCSDWCHGSLEPAAIVIDGMPLCQIHGDAFLKAWKAGAR